MGPIPTPIVVLQVAAELPSGLPEEDSLASRIETALKVVLEQVPVAPAGGSVELSVTLTDESEIRALNREHRGIDSATDVLSFPIAGKEEATPAEPVPQSEGPPLLLGDLVLCPGIIAWQAGERDLRTHERFAECLLHGILHLLGFEHTSEQGRGRMEALEDILDPLVAPVFDPLGGAKG